MTTLSILIACSLAGTPTTSVPTAVPSPAAVAMVKLRPPASITDKQSAALQWNSFVSTSDDPFSTFALDVDTSSYTVARSYISIGQLPPSEVVRVEEFINYFSYDYPMPESGAFGIQVDAAPSPWENSSGAATHIVRVGIQGRPVDDSQRADAVLTFVIDISGSMSEPDRLPLVKEALRLLVSELRDSDQVGIVVYNDTAQVVLEHTSGKQRDRIRQIIDALEADRRTNVEDGLRVGYELAARGFKRGATNRVILCSDGLANEGAVDPYNILQTVGKYAAQGVLLTTVGFGMGEYNDYLMEQLANDNNGQYAYVDTLTAARRIFVENLTSTLQLIARDAKIQVEFNPGAIDHYRLLGYENRSIADDDFRNDKADAGEVGASQSVTALYKVVPNKQDSGIAITVTLRYIDSKTDEVQEIERSLDRSEFGRSFTDASPHLQLAVVVAEFAEQLRSKGYARARSLDYVRAEAAYVGLQLPSDQKVQEFVRLVKRASEVWNK